MIEYTLEQIIMVSVFMLWAYGVQFVNMLVGAWINRERFDFRKFISGLYDPIWIYVIVVATVIMVSTVPFLLSQYQIMEIDLTGLEAFTGRSIVILAVGYGINRLKDVYKKVTERIGLKIEDVKVIDETEGVG